MSYRWIALSVQQLKALHLHPSDFRLLIEHFCRLFQLRNYFVPVRLLLHFRVLPSEGKSLRLDRLLGVPLLQYMSVEENRLCEWNGANQKWD